MASFSTNEFKSGLKVLIDGDPCMIVENEFVKPGKGQAFNRVKIKNLKTGRVVEKTFKSGDSVEAADVIDLDTVKTGERRAGAYFSIWSMTRKASYALGITIGTGAAVLFGFDSLADPVNNPNSSESLLWLACLYSVIPAMFKFVAMPLLWNYPLTEARLAEVQKEIQAEPESVPSPMKS